MIKLTAKTKKGKDRIKMKPSEIVDKIVTEIYCRYRGELPLFKSELSLMIKNWLLDNNISIQDNNQTSKDKDV